MNEIWDGLRMGANEHRAETGNRCLGGRKTKFIGLFMGKNCDYVRV